jgi:hypothetical protein
MNWRALPFKTLELLVVIPAEAGIQDDEKTEFLSR